MELMFRALFHPKNLKSRSHVDSFSCLLILISVYIVSFWPFFAHSMVWWKVLVAWGVLAPMYVYGVAGVYMLLIRLDDPVGLVLAFPGVMAPYLFFPPLYAFTKSPLSFLPLSIWSGYLEILVVTGGGKGGLLKTKVLFFKLVRIAVFFLVMSR